jgi:hypothetical protein
MSAKKNVVAVPAVVVPVLDPSQQAFNLKHLSVYLGASEWQCRSLIWEGKLLACKIGRNLSVRRVDADNYLASLTPVSTSDAEWLKNRQAKCQVVRAATERRVVAA